MNSGPASSANVGKNPCFGVVGCPLGASSTLVPIAFGGVRLTTEDVQSLLGKGLDVDGNGTVDIPGFGYKRFQTFSGNGIGDVITGFRYQYLRTEDWRLAFTGAVRFPSGKVEDPDNLTDAAFGIGTYSLLFHLNNDFVISNLWRGTRKSPAEGALLAEPGDLVVNGTFRYEVLLPDKQKLRVPSNVNNPVTINKEKVNRDLGDVFEFEVSGKYTLLQGLDFSALYKYGFNLKDRVSGKLGFAYNSLEEETRRMEQIYIIGLSYTTIPLYGEKKFFLPMTASISYRNRFAGNNNYQRAQYIGTGLQFFF